MLARLAGNATDATERFSGGGNNGETLSNQSNNQSANSKYRGARGLSPELIAEIERCTGWINLFMSVLVKCQKLFSIRFR